LPATYRHQQPQQQSNNASILSYSSSISHQHRQAKKLTIAELVRAVAAAVPPQTASLPEATCNKGKKKKKKLGAG
jgi:hypothetical protein